MLGNGLGTVPAMIHWGVVVGACKGLEEVLVYVLVAKGGAIRSCLLQQGDEPFLAEATRRRSVAALACGWDRSGWTWVHTLLFFFVLATNFFATYTTKNTA